MQSPEFEQVKEQQVHLGLLTPIYPLTEGISGKWLRSRIKWVVDKLDYIVDLNEHLPKTIINKYKLEPIKFAVNQIHFPDNRTNLAKARRRIAFDELLKIQMQIQKQKQTNRRLRAKQISLNNKLLEELISSFGFDLTNDQHKAVKEIAQDLSKPSPMNRLLSGDVGSGKTIVAIAAALLTAKTGYQTAILAPTTVLADQHFKSFTNLLKPFGISTKLVSSNSTKKDTKNAQVIIGTQAILFQKTELFTAWP